MLPTIKFKGGKTKYVLKKIMASLLPKPILDRKHKMGFPVPLKEWWDGPLKEFVSDTLLSKSCRERVCLIQKAWRNSFERKTNLTGRYGVPCAWNYGTGCFLMEMQSDECTTEDTHSFSARSVSLLALHG